MRTLHRTKWTGETGLTLIEIMLTTVVMLIAVGGLSSSILSSIRLSRVNDESARAHAAARQMAEIIQDVDFDQIFVMFNDDASDDPVGDAPGNLFDIAGLTAIAGDEDGAVGTILFPTVDTAGGRALREDIVDEDLGMPRDLNGDGVVDSSDHSGDYLILPVTIRVQWRGAAGNRQMDLDLVLVE